MKLFEKQTRIPGARPLYDDAGKRLVDKKGREVWDMPAPIATAIHWRNNAARTNPNINPAQYIKEVPVYRGMSALMYREARSKIRRQLRKLNDDNNQSGSDQGQSVAIGEPVDDNAAAVS